MRRFLSREMGRPMSLLELIKTRRSIRKFKREQISDEIIDQLIEAMIWAPSAGNLQSRKFYFVFNQTMKEKLVSAALGQRFIAEAPLAIVSCVDYDVGRHYGRRGEELYCQHDVAASIENLLLLAHEKNLGAVWVGAFNEEPVVKVLSLPRNLRPVAIVAVGYPAEKPKAPPRVRREEAVTFIR